MEEVDQDQYMPQQDECAELEEAEQVDQPLNDYGGEGEAENGEGLDYVEHVSQDQVDNEQVRSLKTARFSSPFLQARLIRPMPEYYYFLL